MTTNAENAELVEAGRPDPAAFRFARPVWTFAKGTVLSATGAQTVLLPIAGAVLVRFRSLFTAAGTLSFVYRRNVPDHATAYTETPAPVSNVSVAANTAVSTDVSPGGESILAVTWTPNGVDAATVTYFDVMQKARA